MRKSPVLIISGPTASGKTRLSLKLALKIQSTLNRKAEIINFDSLLFYQKLNIGTAKPSQTEQEQIKHHLIDISPIDSTLNASDYIKMAEAKINELLDKGIIPLLVGGSAFYLRALVKGMYNDPDNNDQNEELKEKIAQETAELVKTQGITPVRDYLLLNDPESYYQLHENDHYRNARAYEFYRLTGKKISEQKKIADDALPYNFQEHLHTDWNIHHYYLNIPKPDHWPIIESRTQKMFENGLVQEVEFLLKEGFSAHEKPLRSIGYKEVVELLNQEVNLQECQEKISIATRQLAKAQRTFFNKIEPKQTFNPLKEEDDFYKTALNDLNEEKNES